MSIIGMFKRLISGASAAATPQKQLQHVLQTPPQHAPQVKQNGNTRTLLKEATALKRAKRYDEAVAMLLRAYDALPGPMRIDERLRLPMYLQLAGRADEGWREMNRLNIKYVDKASQITISAHMAAFLRKEGKHKNAALFAVCTLCKYKELDVDTHAVLVHMADQRPASDAEWRELGLPPWPQTMPVTGTTPSGNPIYDVSYPAVKNRLAEDYGPEAIRATLELDLAKVATAEIISNMVTDLSRYLARSPPYDIESVNSIFTKHLA